MIYGLPGQTMAHWQDSVEQVLSLCPEHLSCYGLKLEEGTPFWRQQDTLSFPDEDAQADAYLWLCQRMEQSGFVHYEISNFGKPGRESRHNLKYWNLEDYLGLGPAAHSDLRGVRFGYARDLEGYIRVDCPLSERKKISPPERLEEYVMLGLRLGRGIDPQGYRQYGGDNWAAVETEFQALQAHGLVELTAGHWHCTPQGFLVSNALIGAVLERVSYTEKT
ncbi:MAG: hypothetical protein LUD79_00725 [Oscillospiraceae bacterium]|nr:hypothetical protein [Oscillospiraceae bacterium]